MELVNTHCHSRYCGHGAGEVEDYAAAAEAAGLTTLAFTEHFPLSASFDPDGYLSVPWDQMAAYREAVERAREAHPSLDIILGCEMDYLGADEDRAITAADLAPYELVLGSVHFVDAWAFDDPAQRGAWEEPGAPERIWRRYTELWCAAAADASQPFHVMSHPDLAKKFAYYPSYDLAPLYEAMAEACASTGRMIEVNTSGSYYACAEMFPAPALLAAFRRAGVPCTVGSDAHDPANVARDIERGYELMARAGYRCVTVPTRSGDRREIPLA
ncbi:MAG: histidinol-phosphatase HisJ family protein [Eggerthellaceae bacterium]|nr:histidinol-phosphatase HisJ family protein [Eggerthellaceae bacterium]